MTCKPEALKNVPLFSLLDDDEIQVLAADAELKSFAPRERIYKIGDPGKNAYVTLSGRVRVTTVDEDNQEVIVDEAAAGDFFGFASMIEQSPHQTSASALEPTTLLEVSRDDIESLIARKPHAGMDLLTTLGRQFHASQGLVRTRAMRNANEVIEERVTWPEHIADVVATFGGSWTFIIICLVVMAVYTLINIALGQKAWDPYPFILLNLFLSMMAAIQAPVIMMSQNRQDKKDRVRDELDFDVNRRAEAEIKALSAKFNSLDDKLDDVVSLLRQPTKP
jgi:CRP/FNR family transcriptional regulator, cyclic AMP receptor protein